MLCRDDVSCRIGMSVQHHFRIARCSRAEISEHRVITLCVTSFKRGGVLFYLSEKIRPALLRAVTDEFLLHIVIFFERCIYMLSYLVLEGRKYVLHTCRLEAIYVVLFHKLAGSRNKHCTYLHKSVGCKPELIMAFEHSHYHIALLNAVSDKHISSLIALLNELTVGKLLFLAVLPEPVHNSLVRHFFAYPIKNIIGKVKVIVKCQLSKIQHSVLIEALFKKLLVKSSDIESHVLTPYLKSSLSSSGLEIIMSAPAVSSSSCPRKPHSQPMHFIPAL